MSLDDVLYDYLNDHEFTIEDVRLGDYIDPARGGKEIGNDRVLMLVNHKRGFSYQMVMPWHEPDGPTLAEICLWIENVYDRVKAQFDQNGVSADPPFHDANNYNAILESELDSIVGSFSEIAAQDRADLGPR